jgi:hypothetical protein
MSECLKDKEPHIGQCCCTCYNHRKDYHHPYTTGGSILEQRGWVCYLPIGKEEEHLLFSGWSEHGMCELWNPKEE